MIGALAKRLAEGAVLVLAAIAFFLVPLGGKTPAQHVVAIFTTKPAREAGAALADAAHHASAKAMQLVAELRTRGDKPVR